MANVVIGSLQIRLSAATAEFNANIQAARKGLKRFRKSGHEVATGGIALASFSRALLGVGRAAGEAAGALSGRRRLLAGPEYLRPPRRRDAGGHELALVRVELRPLHWVPPGRSCYQKVPAAGDRLRAAATGPTSGTR